MIKSGMIFFGLMVAASAAGFAISFSHDAFIQQQRLAAVSPAPEVVTTTDPMQLGKPAAVAKAMDLPVISTTADQPVRTMAPARVDTTLTSAAELTTPHAFASFGTREPEAQAVVSSQDQSLAPGIATLRPQMRDAATDLAAGAPVTAAPKPVVRIQPAPLAMNLPVYSYAPDSRPSVVTTTKTRIAPEPRYLIGVYR